MARTDNFQKHLDGECACPLCGETTNVEGKDVQINKNRAEQKMYCVACGGSWIDIYVLSDINAVSRDESEEDGDTGGS